MNSLDHLRSSREQLDSAVAFVALIGRPVSEADGAPCHILHSINVTTRILAPGWSGGRVDTLLCSGFDAALGEVIKESFGELSQAAIGRMKLVVVQRAEIVGAELRDAAEAKS